FDGMSSSSKSPSVPSDKSKPSGEGFQEKHSIAKKKITSGSNTPVSSSNVDVTELMKALRVVRRAKEKNIDLTTSMESLAMAQLKPRHRRRMQRQRSRWKSIRWFFYVIFWIVAVLYFIALINRNTVCSWITDSKITEF
uniref:Ferlin_C domain-containing protein n=1 Tax=Haemonchus contortus TaxID=6289 RepID=A0A7I4YPS8_HAECO